MSGIILEFGLQTGEAKSREGFAKRHRLIAKRSPSFDYCHDY